MGLLSGSEEIVGFPVLWDFDELCHPKLIAIEVHHRRSRGVFCRNQYAIRTFWSARNSTNERFGPVVLVVDRTLVEAAA